MNIGSKKKFTSWSESREIGKSISKNHEFCTWEIFSKNGFFEKFFFHLKERIKLYASIEIYSKIFIHSRVIDKVLFLEHH